MKYIRKDCFLINVDKCVYIKVEKHGEFTWALVFQNEDNYSSFWYEDKENAYGDMMRIEAFITDERKLLKL